MSEQQHHYFATTPFSWAKADTIEEVLEKIGGFDSEAIKQGVKSKLLCMCGLVVWKFHSTSNMPSTSFNQRVM